MRLCLRVVPYGTQFTPQPGVRLAAPANEQDEPSLFDNEIAVDVGGACFSWQGETRAIFDHHFARQTPPYGDDNYPAAACAVLHQIKDVADRVRRNQESGAAELWIITHRDPDLDALTATYLVAKIAQGELADWSGQPLGLEPAGWRQPAPKGRRIDWLEPHLPADASKAWPIILAALAARQDQCHPSPVPRTQAVHAVLYAAQKRRKTFATAENSPRAGLDCIEGILAFFDHLRERIVHHGLNPLLEGPFAPDGPFAPELALLERDLESYRRDLQRARIASVILPQKADFATWSKACLAQPLLRADGSLAAPHTLEATHDPALGFKTADGIFIRHPESLLFKEWARADTEHSPRRGGFLFTAVVVPSPTKSTGNPQEYFFSLDPERAGAAHLYPVWAVLQQAELEAAQACGLVPAKKESREGYAGRAGNDQPWSRYFDDPWFDGINFRATIVVTAGRGTCLPGGSRANLGDDGPTTLVRSVLEDGFFAANPDGRRPLAVHDFPVEGPPTAAPAETSFDLALEAAARGTPPPPECLRFARTTLASASVLADGACARQIGERLWAVLSAAPVQPLPGDFSARHLIVDHHGIAVWNRHGFALALDPAAPEVGEQLLQAAARLARVRRRLHALASSSGSADDASAADACFQSILHLRLQASQPGQRVLRRYLDATQFHQVIEALHALCQQRAAEAAEVLRRSEETRRAAVEAAEQRHEKRRERALALFGALVAAPGLVLTFLQVYGINAPSPFTLPGILAMVLGSVFVVGGGLLPQLSSRKGPSWIIGLLLVLAGLAVGLWGFSHLKEETSPPSPAPAVSTTTPPPPPAVAPPPVTSVAPARTP